MLNEIIDFKYRERGKDTLINKEHSHTYHFEILHITSGSGIIMVNKQFFPLKKNTIVFINGIDIHCSIPDDATNYVRSKLVFSSLFLQSLAELMESTEIVKDLFMNTNGLCINLKPDEDAFIDTEMQRIEDNIEKESMYQKADITLSILKILICAHKNKHHYTSSLNNKMSDVLDYINLHLEQKISLEELCQHVHVSKYHLCHTFKNTVGMTVFDYILAQRISVARKKLLYSEDSLSEIALTTGFSSFSYFSKVFKEFEEVSPKEFRKNRDAHLPW